MFKSVVIKDGNKIIKGMFDKFFVNDEYEVYFNTKTGFEVLKGKKGLDPFQTELPLLLDVGIMGHCLNSCSFCYQGPKHEPHMTFENFKSIIDQTKHHTNQVALGGRGDPNLHPQFKEIVEYTRDSGMAVNYTTSGRNLTDEQIEISKMCGAVAVSAYDRDFTYDALERLMNAGIKTNIHLIFSKDNYNKAMNIVKGYDIWNGKVNINKLNALIFLLFKPQGSGKDKLELIPTKEQLESFSKFVFNPKCKFKIGMDSCLINHVIKYKTPSTIQQMAIDTCESSRMSVYISPSMQLIPCSFAEHSETGVEITKQKDIKNIWNSAFSFNQFRNKLRKNPNCCPIGL